MSGWGSSVNNESICYHDGLRLSFHDAVAMYSRPSAPDFNDWKVGMRVGVLATPVAEGPSSERVTKAP